MDKWMFVLLNCVLKHVFDLRLVGFERVDWVRPKP